MLNRATVSLQVKFSKDLLVTHMKPGFQQKLRACGWWNLNRDKLVKSRADYWVFVHQGFASRSTDFVIIPREQLLETLSAIHGARKTMQSYIWVTQGKRCWETRGLKGPDQLQVAGGDYQHPRRDLTKWLNNWAPIASLDRQA
jgi:hypothetical protein